MTSTVVALYNKTVVVIAGVLVSTKVLGPFSIQISSASKSIQVVPSVHQVTVANKLHACMKLSSKCCGFL